MSETSWKSPHEYKIGGVPVSFPAKAYPSQMAMMAKIITSLQKGRNCLLESPTGSGKSLALLCASLAWQRAEIKRVTEYNEAVKNGIIEPEEVPYDPNQDDGDEDEPGVDSGAGFFVPTNQAAFRGDEDDDFQDPYRPQERVVNNATEVNPVVPSNNPSTKKVMKKKVPRIYFGTRTHKQLTQIVRELRKTAYSDVKMSILGSRDHTCIEPNVSKMKNKNEGCKELRENEYGCSFQSNVKSKLSDHYAFNSYRGKSDAWDLEDMVKVGKKVRACPYYAIRELKNKSHIVFCPYNYLVEPSIRKSMEIHLKNNIVILDEAHNIEDSARSAASWQVTQEQIREAMNDLEKMAAFYRETQKSDPGPYLKMAELLSKVSTWIDEAKSDIMDTTCQSFNEFGSTSKVWTGTNVSAKFTIHGFGPTALKEEYLKEFEKMCADVKVQSEEEASEAKYLRNSEFKTPTVHSTTMSILEAFWTVMQYMYEKDQKFRDDFRVALVKTQERAKSFDTKKKGQWFSKNKSGTVLDYNYSAHFWCLNPAVIFDELKGSVRSIVLTSGTLSPMASFSSELNVEFPIQLEANHVIEKKQVWIGTLSHGPSGVELKATYEHTESYQFQDEIGKLTLKICNTIAHGVLLFLPSYKLLNKLCERWQATGLWNEIGNKKVIISEPRFSDEFECAIRHFYEVIETTTKNPNPDGIDGALFIAVCRGKVSEGLDFADNNARAVICLGIPFPNIRDAQVKLKMTYNDKRHDSDKAILTGRDWYEIQAFRALNQALGRCIRHRKDWGAILMVDQRYGTIRRYVESLSKWVRNGVQHHSNCHDVLDQLALFRQDMAEMDREYQEELAKKKALEPDVPPVSLNQPSQPQPKKKTNRRQERKNIHQPEKVPLNQWVGKGQVFKPMPQTQVPVILTEPKPQRFTLSSIENETQMKEGSSPLKKKFKFSSGSKSSDEDQTPKLKFQSENQVKIESPSSQPIRPKFIPPARKPDFYGDDSDEDFQ